MGSVFWACPDGQTGLIGQSFRYFFPLQVPARFLKPCRYKHIPLAGSQGGTQSLTSFNSNPIILFVKSTFFIYFGKIWTTTLL